MTGSGDNYDIDELLGAYALDALEPDERRRVEDYLAINPRAAAEVQAHREVATMLAFTGMDAPPELWDRIAAELDESPPAPGPELAKVLSIHDRPRRGRVAAVLPWLVAGAAAAIVTVVAVNVLRPDDGPVDPVAAAIDEARGDRDSISTILSAEGSDVAAEAIIDQDGHGFLLASDLPTLADDMTYQLWGVVSDGQVISLGILGPSPEIETFTVDGEVSAMAITIERTPGVISDGNPDGAFVGTF